MGTFPGYEKGIFVIAPLVLIETDKRLCDYWKEKYNDPDLAMWVSYDSSSFSIVTMGINTAVVLSHPFQAITFVHETYHVIQALEGKIRAGLSSEERDIIENTLLNMHTFLAESIGGAFYKETVNEVADYLIPLIDTKGIPNSNVSEVFDAPVKKMEAVFGKSLSISEDALRHQTF